MEQIGQSTGCPVAGFGRHVRDQLILPDYVGCHNSRLCMTNFETRRPSHPRVVKNIAGWEFSLPQYPRVVLKQKHELDQHRILSFVLEYLEDLYLSCHPNIYWHP